MAGGCLFNKLSSAAELSCVAQSCLNAVCPLLTIRHSRCSSGPIIMQSSGQAYERPRSQPITNKKIKPIS